MSNSTALLASSMSNSTADTSRDLEINADSAWEPEQHKSLLSNSTPDAPKIDRTDLDPTLARLETVLMLLGFNQSTALNTFLAWLVFVGLGAVVPAVMLWATSCTGCHKVQVIKFELMIQISDSGLAAVTMLCMAYNIRRYGLRRLLLLDQVRHPLVRFRLDFQSQFWESFRLVKWIIFPCLVVKIIREVWRTVVVHQGPWWESALVLIGIIISWLYLTAIFLFACILFNLVCSMQIVHVEDYMRLLEGTSDVSVFLKEHMQLRYQLYKISHRFRVFLLLAFLVVTGSQFMTLFETTYYSGSINFINAGDFLVSSVVQVVGVILCLRAAAKTTHRAQGIASVASQWHAWATCNSCDAIESKDEINGDGSTDVFPIYSLFAAEYESDMESEALNIPNDSQFASHVASYHKRQALVMYFQFNHTGISIFGWQVDRALMNTLLFVELSLITWVLGKTIILNSK